MRFLGLILSFPPIFYTIYKFNKHRDLLHVQNAVSIIYILEISIPTILYFFNIYTESIRNSFVRTAVLSDAVYLEYSLIQTICYFLLLMGTRVKFCFPRHIRVERRKVLPSEWDYRNYKFWGIAFWCIGVVSFFFIMRNTGGIRYFFNHLQNRIFLTKDLDLLTWILPLANYGILLIAYSYRGTDKKIGPGLWILAVLTGLITGLGGRKAVIILILEMVILHHYTVRPIEVKKIFRLRNLWIVPALYLFFVIYRGLRTPDAMELFLAHPAAFVLDNGNGLIGLFCEESYVPYYMTAIRYFSNHALWMGSSFLGLLTAFVPSSLYPAKPPVDDGMYLYSICRGREDIFPVMAAGNLNGSSYPLETFGSMYANFGIIGVFLGFLALGILLGHLYRKIYASDFRMMYIVLYAVALFEFQFSTLRIMQFLEAIVLVGLAEVFGRNIYVNKNG